MNIPQNRFLAGVAVGAILMGGVWTLTRLIEAAPSPAAVAAGAVAHEQPAPASDRVHKPAFNGKTY